MITLEDLSKRYGDTTVVDGVSMTIESNTISVIVGTSGSGKSTLLRMINRLVEPSNGRVLIDGKDTHSEPAHLLRRRIGYAIQGHGLFPHRTVAENIATVPHLLGWPEERIRPRIEELLRAFQLEPASYADKYPHQLSGGQQQRVGVARALAAAPRLMLLDEPFGALDPITRDRLQQSFVTLRRRLGLTAVFVTHDMTEALLLADRIGVMRGGQLIQLGTPAELLRAPRDAHVAQLLDTPRRQAQLVETLLRGES